MYTLMQCSQHICSYMLLFALIYTITIPFPSLKIRRQTSDPSIPAQTPYQFPLKKPKSKANSKASYAIYKFHFKRPPINPHEQSHNASATTHQALATHPELTKKSKILPAFCPSNRHSSLTCFFLRAPFPCTASLRMRSLSTRYGFG
jgi:hypothetical protein